MPQYVSQCHARPYSAGSDTGLGSENRKCTGAQDDSLSVFQTMKKYSVMLVNLCRLTGKIHIFLAYS